MPKLIIKYNIALSHENYDELDTAEKEYEQLLLDLQIDAHEKNTEKEVDEYMTDLLLRLKAACHRQLGWISYRRTYKDEKNRQELLKKAQDQLNQANEIDSRDGQNYYYLGRVYGEQDCCPNGVMDTDDQAHEAFVNYRHSIDKREQNADTWCSIGALYQKQNQPMDALQAFICSIELNPNLSAAWTDLGELYEKNAQFHDALECFRNAMKNNPVAPEPIKARVAFLDKELALQIPVRPPNHIIPETFNVAIPSLEEAYEQPIPLELRNRQDAAYQELLAEYDNSFWDLWVDFKTMDLGSPDGMPWEVPEPKPMGDLEIQVMELLRANEGALVKAEREVLECLETNEAVYKGHLFEFIIPEAIQEMPRVTEEMIQNLRDHGHLLESPRCYDFPFLPKCPIFELPPSFSLLSKLYIPVDISAQELMAMVTKRSQMSHTHTPVFEEFAQLPTAPKLPEKPIATEEEIKTALERNEKHPLIMKTPILTIDNRKEALSIELQRYLDSSTIACIRGLTSCLRLDLSLFSTKAVVEIDGGQEIEVRTQYHLPPETNCDHASVKTWVCISEPSCTSIVKYAQYQQETFKHTLKSEAEKIRKHGGGGRGPSPKRQKLSVKRPVSPPKDLKSIKFGTNIDLSDDAKWGKQISELSKLPAFCRLIAGSNMLSHLGHQVLGMNTVQLDMRVPGARTTAHQESNNVASVNINIGPGECEWFAVPYNYAGKLEKLCEEKGIDFFKGTFWPIMDELLAEGIPVHRFTQKAGDMVYVNGGSVYWMQAMNWCNNISWNVAPINNTQMTKALHSYEYNKLRRHKSEVPMQLVCWQIAKNVKFTNQLIHNTVKGVLIRSLAFLKMVSDFLGAHKKTIKTHARGSGEQSHFCMTCECEVFSILFVKEMDGKFNVFCIYCALAQGLDHFIALQQFPFNDLQSVYDNMKYNPTINNNKMSFTA